jgi:NAD(P) transhydrogenase subunit beta
MNINFFINSIYLISAVLFILGLKLLSSPKTAIKGNFISAIGMLLAVVVTLLNKEIIDYTWLSIGLIIGTVIGIFAARIVAMTAMPEMVALLNGFGGIASLLVGWAVHSSSQSLNVFTASTIFLSILIGGVTFTGSLIAWGKLNGKITGKPVLFAGQKIVNSIIVLSLIILGIIYSVYPFGTYLILISIIIGSLILGVSLVIPIGGADMPVVISLLNSYSGLAACSAGFVIENNVLIVAGALVGASGIILTSIMCKAMNRSLSNVLFSGFGSAVSSSSEDQQGEVKASSPKDAYFVLEAAKSVVIVPGYGLAVAQAQHVTRELASLLEENGAEVKYAIHPVAGRMPGHMNVLLAEADVPYEQLIEMDDINRSIDTIDVCLVIGANDVVNLSARDNETSPIFGMPIIEVDKATNVFVLKRSMASGFAGIANPLFFKDNTTMLFGDAKATLQNLISEF